MQDRAVLPYVVVICVDCGAEMERSRVRAIVIHTYPDTDTRTPVVEYNCRTVGCSCKVFVEGR